jgi:hypothetical protein
MQIIRDEKLVARRKKIGQIASLVGIAVLLGGMAFTWLAPNWDVPVQFTIYVPFLALLVGFILSSIGIYHTNRWGRSPRPDEILDKSLKGLGGEYNLYHFALPVSHLLLTPSGPVVLIVKTEGREYTVEGDRWRQRFSLGTVLRFMGQEGLGNPTKEANYQIEQMRRSLAKHAPELADTPVTAIIVFTADQVTLNVGETSIPVVRAAKLKGFLRSRAVKPLPRATYRKLEELFAPPAE